MEQYVILIFILIIICISYLFNSYTMYQKNYAPVELKSSQYNTFKTKNNIPESLEGVKNINYANFIEQCDPKHCVINIKTGIKRCPDGDNSLVYDNRVEACTKIDTCDSSFQPYAVQEDGSVTKSNFCGKGINCRCTQDLACPYKDLSYFNLRTDGFTGGNYNTIEIYSGLSASKNPGKVSIKPGENDYCKLNPAELTQIKNGCELTNSLGDPINCSDNNNYGMMTLYGESEGSFIGKVSIHYQCDYKSSNDFKDHYTLNVISDFKIEEGIFKLVNPSKGTSTYVKGVYKNTPRPGSMDLGVIQPISQYYDENLNIINTKDWLTTCKSVVGSTTAGTSVDVYFYGNNNKCLQDKEVNYKNLLMCTQTYNNICPSGVLSYNYDQETYSENMGEREDFSRRFCQFSSLGNDYMKSPGTDTISCTTGSGCNGDNLLENEDSNKYFPDFDISGIKNLFTFSLNKDSFSKNTQDVNDLVNYNPVDKFQIYKSNLTKGDIWSIVNLNNILIYTGTSTNNPGGNCKSLPGISYVSVNNIGIFTNIDLINNPQTATFGTCLGVSYEVKYKCLKSTGERYIGLNVSSENPLPSDIKQGDTISITTDIEKDKAGILKEDNINELKLVNFEGNENPVSYTGSSVNYTFIKQFGFNGFNYNTTVTGPSSGTIKYRRVNKFGLVSPYSETNNYFTNNSLQVESVVENSPFKTKFSSYYPVWNPVLQRQECIRCKPLLFSYLVMNDIDIISQSIQNVIIQYSGRDFQHYESNLHGKNQFGFTTMSKMKLNDKLKRSTSSIIYLESPNPNIKKGDYIIDSRLQLPTNYFVEGVDSIKFSPSVNGVSTSSSGLCMVNLIGDFGINESTNDIIYYEGTSLPDNNELYLLETGKDTNKKYTISPNNNPVNYFYGKYYNNTGSSGGVYLNPVVKVNEINDNNTTIITDSKISLYLNSEETYFQFCRLDNYLGLSVVSNNIVLDAGLEINRLTEGRISNINISKDKEDKALNTNGFTPEIKISNYTPLI